MSTQHTPGEWRISGISQEDGSISIAKNQIVICYVTNAASIFEVVLKQTPETQFANAHLIAAAPDMYEALLVALKALEAISDEMTIGERYTNAGQYLIDSLTPVREVIAKVEGK